MIKKSVLVFVMMMVISTGAFGSLMLERAHQFYKDKKYDKALINCLQALEVFKELDNKREIRYSLTNIGLAYFDKGDLDKALVYYTRSLNLQ